MAMSHIIIMFYTPLPFVLSTNIRNQAYMSHLNNSFSFNPLKKIVASTAKTAAPCNLKDYIFIYALYSRVSNDSQSK